MTKPGGSLKELQKHWYKILEESGFKDIETMVGNELVLKQAANHHIWDKHPLDREMTEEYFRVLFHKAHDEKTLYRNDLDRVTMQMYSDGSKICGIAKITGRARNSIRFIIRRYETAWGIRDRSKEELNRYD